MLTAFPARGFPVPVLPPSLSIRRSIDVSRLIRMVLIAVIASAGAGGFGCGPSKKESTPNPDFKVPDIKPGDRSHDKDSTPGKK